jgi:hypothetical protein
MRSVLGRVARKSGPSLIRFTAFFGILGLLAMGAGELIGAMTRVPSAVALGLRGSIEPTEDIALVPTHETDWAEAAEALGLKDTVPAEERIVPASERMVPAPYLLR